MNKDLKSILTNCFHKPSGMWPIVFSGAVAHILAPLMPWELTLLFLLGTHNFSFSFLLMFSNYYHSQNS